MYHAEQVSSADPYHTLSLGICRYHTMGFHCSKNPDHSLSTSSPALGCLTPTSGLYMCMYMYALSHTHMLIK